MPPTTNERITSAAWLAARGDLPNAPTTPGWCLQLVRVVVEFALAWQPHELYARYLVAGTTRRPGDDRTRAAAAKLDPFAADFEASCKKLGFAIPMADREPGDFIFNHNAAVPFGHVGVLLDRSTVLELIDPKHRPLSVHLPGSLAITPIATRPWTLVARLPTEGGDPPSI